jgi:hypothetical protein
MQFTTAFTLALLSLASTVSAHMRMAKPAPFGNPSSSPLAADGSDFPCKVGAAYSYDNTPATSMALGSTQPLTFIGSAVHGGGSCQVSITYDKNPTKSSVWKVIHSIEGGCPAKNVAGNLPANADGADPDTYSFTVPTNLPTGQATIAWTWFNKIGNREMYMNCGPISLTGGSSKRDLDVETQNAAELLVRDQAAFDALPNMFVANIGRGCATVETTDLVFPQPGNSVEKLAASPNYGGPTGNCPTGNAAPPAATPAQIPTATAGSPGIFVTIPAVATTSPVPSKPAPQPASTISTGSGSVPTGSGSVPTGACTPEGHWNCIAGTSYQRCASGTWSAVQNLAAGTQCTPGQSSAIDITAKTASKNKRTGRPIRFSQEHVRRRQEQAVWVFDPLCRWTTGAVGALRGSLGW